MEMMIHINEVKVYAFVRDFHVMCVCAGAGAPERLGERLRATPRADLELFIAEVPDWWYLSVEHPDYRTASVEELVGWFVERAPRLVEFWGRQPLSVSSPERLWRQ